MYLKKYLSYISVLSLASVLLIIGCSKGFLDKPALGALVPNQVNNKAGVTAFLMGAYAVLDGQGSGNTAVGGGNAWEASPSNWIYGSVAGGDSHKGSSINDQPPIVPIANAQEVPSNGFFNDKWKALYEGVSRCNVTLTTLAASTDPYISAADRTEFSAEAKFLRAHYYFELRRFFHMVPWIDETTTDMNQPNDQDIYPKIEADLKVAVDSLPATQQNVGQINKWGAMCYLAKVYLYEQKYSEAKALFDQVIPVAYGGPGVGGVTSNGLSYGLTDRFEDNFDAAAKNNKESVFAIQMTAHDGTNGIAHANGGDMLNFPYNSPFRCCGFFQPSVDLANSYRTDPDGLPYVTDYNLHPVANDQGIASDKPFTPDAGNLDPRIDWTVARRGIPVHDWGLHPGNNWIRDQGSAGPYSNKKNLYWQGTSGTYSDQSTWAPGSAINYCIIRFADVLLMAAECEAQLGNYSKAEEYVNYVRMRAANPVNILHTYIDPAKPMGGFTNTPAANYVIAPYPAGTFNAGNALPAIYFERKLELACEGHRFFDLARWGIAAATMNAYYAFERQITGDLSTGNFTADKNEYFPIPQAQIDLSKGKLKQNKGY